MDQVENTPRKSDEIDLTQFFRWVGRGFTRVGNSIFFFIATLRNLFFENRLFFAGILVLGVGLGALYSILLKKDYYKSSMVLSCDYLNTQILENTFEKLNLLASEEQREGLQLELNIDSAIAYNIQEFDFEPFVSEDEVVEMEVLREQLNNVDVEKKSVVDKVLSKLVVTNKNAYMISAYVYDPSIVKPLEQALIRYLSANPYVSRRIEINKVNLQSRKDKLLVESHKLDSLKRVIFESYQALGKTSRGSNNVILGDEKLANPLDVFTKDLELNATILEIERDLFLNKDFEVVDGFTTFREPDSLSLFQVLIISFFLSWVMGYIIIGAWTLDQKLSKVPTAKIIVAKH